MTVVTTEGGLAAEFAAVFRDEHRQVRDSLLDLVAAVEAGDLVRARSLLERIAGLTGPHFRYEEDSLYPALVAIFGEEYVQKLLEDHDRAIGAAERLVELAAGDALTGAETAEAVRLTRGILPHVSDCDGLSIMVEVLTDDTVRGIFDSRERSLGEGLDLLTWARGIRGRPIVRP